MDTNLTLFVAALVIGIISFGLYQHGIFKGSTKPHPLSWLVWLLTLGVATYGTLIGGGGYGAVYHVIYTVMVSITFVRSLFCTGFDKVDRIDYYMFSTALLAIPLLIFVSEAAAVFLVTVVDFIGYVMTWRKCYDDPWSEPLVSWILAVPTLFLVAVVMGEYNFLTLFYPVVTLASTIVLVLVCIVRRNDLPKPQVSEVG